MKRKVEADANSRGGGLCAGCFMFPEFDFCLNWISHLFGMRKKMSLAVVIRDFDIGIIIAAVIYLLWFFLIFLLVIWSPLFR